MIPREPSLPSTTAPRHQAIADCAIGVNAEGVRRRGAADFRSTRDGPARRCLARRARPVGGSAASTQELVVKLPEQVVRLGVVIGALVTIVLLARFVVLPTSFFSAKAHQG